MAAGDPPAVLPADFSSEQSPTRLRKELASLSQAFDPAAASLTATAISHILHSAADYDVGGDVDDHDAARVPEELLRQVHGFLTEPSCSQVAADVLSLELPSPVAKLGALCGDSWSFATGIIEFFASNCSPRDTLLIFCEALDKHNSVPVLKGSTYFIILIDGLARVFSLIRRQHAMHVQMAISAVLGCVHYTLSVLDEDHGRNAIDVFNAALGIGNAIQEICKKMAGKEKEEIATLLGLYALQNIAFVSQSKQNHIMSACGPLVVGYSQLLTLCGFSWLGLVTGDDVTSATAKLKEQCGDMLGCFSLAMDGANLAVVWMDKYSDKDQSSVQELQSALEKVNLICMDKWKAVRMFKLIHQHEASLSCASFLITTIRAIESIKMSAPEKSIQVKASAAIKKIIRMVPTSERVLILHDLLKDRMFPASITFLLDLVKEEIDRECNAADQVIRCDQSQDAQALPPCCSDSVNFLHQNLRPRYGGGGDPCLDSWDQVLDCLSLLRFLLIRGAKVLPEPTVRKIYSELLIPLKVFLAAAPPRREKGWLQKRLVWEVLNYCIELADKLTTH